LNACRVKFRRYPVAAGMALLIGVAALALPPEWARTATISWEALLAPYSRGAALPDGFRIDTLGRGPGNDVMLRVRRPGEAAGIEVHILARGRWTDVRESRSFGIAYETPHSPAAEREAITEVLAETLRAHDPGGLPVPDAIALGPTPDPTVLPWWLDTLRGGRGMLVGSSIILLGWLRLVPSPGVALTGLAIGIIDMLLRVAGIPFGPDDIGTAWAIPASALLIVLACRGRPRASRPDCALVLGVAVLAVALRFMLGPWGPLHVNGYGPLFIVGAAHDPAVIAAYGPGYVEIFGPIAALAPSNPDWAIFASNALLSGLVPVLAFALGRWAGLSRSAALVAGLLLALDPVAIRTGATEAYFAPIICLCVAAAVAVLGAARAMQAGQGWQVLAWMGATGLLLAQAARIHPSAWGLVATVPFVVLAGEADNSSRRLLRFLACTAIIGGVVVTTSGGVLLDVWGRVRAGTLMQPSAPPSLWSLVAAVAATLTYAWLAPRKWLSIPAGVCVAAWLMSRHAYGQSWIWQHAYDRLYCTVPLIAATGAIPAFLRRRWVGVAAALIVALIWFRVGLPIVVARTTDHLEYRWLREQLAALPAECRVIYVASAGKRGLSIPTYVGPRTRPAVAMDAREPHTIAEGLSPAACLYYVHTSLCSSPEGRPACAAIEGRLTLVPVARASFPARPSHADFPYDSATVETLVARVEQVERQAEFP